MSRARIGGALVPALAVALSGCAPRHASTVDSPGSVAEAPTRYHEHYIEPPPPIPMALRGCWDSDFDPDWPDAGKSRLTVEADRIVMVSQGEPVRIASPRQVQSVTPTAMHALFAAPEGADWVTVATSLSTHPDDLGTPPDTLRLAEGDAGSWSYSRCKP